MNKADIIDAMVNKFLGWKLPKDFQPNQGISFQRHPPNDYEGDPWWPPVGTNLFTADQARAMITYMLEDVVPPLAESKTTYDSIMNQIDILSGELQYRLSGVNEEYDKLRDMIINATNRTSGWISVKDELPPNGITVLLLHDNIRALGMIHNQEHFLKQYNDYYIGIKRVTHWAHIPAEMDEIE